MPDNSAHFALTYGAELLCETKPLVDKKLLLSSLQRFCPQVIPFGDDGESGSLAFAHTDHPIQLSGRRIAPQTFVAVGDEPLNRSRLQPAIQQSWRFGAVEEVIGRCNYSVMVTDFLASALDCCERLALFLRALAGVLDAVPCLAIHWIKSQQISGPEYFRTPVNLTDTWGLFAGPLNVRLYRISNPPGEIVMDTLGLAAFGLPDVQCHFQKLDPTGVGRVVGNVGYYVLHHGDVIKDRETVEGLQPGERWICHHEQALVPPARVVLDLNPGVPFAACNRG